MGEGGTLDARCSSEGIVISVDKTQKVLRHLRDGQVIRTMEVNIGPDAGDKWFGQYSVTREESNRIFAMERFSVSSMYGMPLPYFMPFDGGLGFHYSDFFEATGYDNNSSYGCVTTRDEQSAKWLFEHAPMKTRVVVYS